MCRRSSEYPPPRTESLVANPCVGEVRSTSPPRPEPLVANPSVGEVSSPSPPKTNCLVANPGDNVMVGNSERVPILEMSVKSGVRTRNQKLRGHSERVSLSPAIS